MMSKARSPLVLFLLLPLLSLSASCIMRVAVATAGSDLATESWRGMRTLLQVCPLTPPSRSAHAYGDSSAPRHPRG